MRLTLHVTGWAMFRCMLLGTLSSFSLVACSVHAPSRPLAAPAESKSPQPVRCSLRVIVAFSQEFSTSPDSAFLKDVERTARVGLSYIRSVTPALHVFTLTASDAGDPSCERALARLRAEPRVRSADIDARRQIQG